MTSPVLTRKDFVSDQEVRWCPGCGDYAILAAIQKVMPELGIPRENIVFVSGIGCSSRFPYYMNTYGFHTIHGRAPAIATGLRIARPDLSVWVITGDGDSLSIGGNHFIHALRRNIDVKILLFNNEIYGLTKGQYSPTSHRGTVTKSTPYGSLDHPFVPATLALGAEASFVARTHDKDMKHMADTFKRAAAHKGTAFVEILQNCVIFNDGVFDETVEKDVRPDRLLMLEDGKPMIFGKDLDKAVVFDGAAPRIVDRPAGDAGLTIHKENEHNVIPALLLSKMHHPEFPVPMGVFRAVDRPIYEGEIERQIADVTAKKGGAGTIDGLLRQGEIWEIA